MYATKFDRRKFVAALSLGTAHFLFNHSLTAAGSSVRSANPLQVVKLGRSGLKTSLIGIGTGVHAGNRSSALTRAGSDHGVRVLLHAYERGIRFFDCADTYGSHPLMSEALKKMNRQKLTLSTKIWTRGGGIPEKERPDADVVVERFRKELNTDYLDIVQIHCMTDADWTDREKKQMDILENLKAKKIIRAHGVSVHSLEAMKKAVETPWVDLIHVRINPYGIAMDKPDPREVVEVITRLHKAGKGVIGMKLIGDGKYQDDNEKIDNALKFVLGLGVVDMIIVGFEKESQIDNYIERTGKALKSA